MQDMISRGDRSIRNIPVPANHRRRHHADEHDQDDGTNLVKFKKRRFMGRNWFWISALLVIAISSLGALMLSTVFAGANITVFPRSEIVTPPQRMVAALDASPGTLPYQTVSVTHSASSTLQASGTTHVERQASGKILIYNNFSSASQRLIANTRFQAPDGRIYRIKVSVDVPGNGSTEAIVYADSAGADYNRTNSTRFTIPGFKGDPRYEKFYGESQGNISGGFVGEEPAVSENNLRETQSSMERILSDALQEATENGVPKDYVLIPGTIKVIFGDVVKGDLRSNSVTVSQSAQAQGQVVRLQDLASYIARQTVSGYGGEAVDFADPSAISISLATSTQSGNKIEIELSGTPTIVWKFDPNAIKTALLGKPKKDFEQIIKSFEPAISKAEARIRPFWQATFPSNPEKIRVSSGNR